MVQGGTAVYSSLLPVPIAASSGEAKYILAAATCMKASSLRILIYGQL